MQWPTTVLVFPLFPTLIKLIKKRAAPYPHAITTTDICYSYSPFISSMVLPGRHEPGEAGGCPLPQQFSFVEKRGPQVIPHRVYLAEVREDIAYT
jgi:hypothetical protein